MRASPNLTWHMTHYPFPHVGRRPAVHLPFHGIASLPSLAYKLALTPRVVPSLIPEAIFFWITKRAWVLKKSCLRLSEFDPAEFLKPPLISN